MSSAAPRVMTLAAVAAIHTGAVLWLLAETRAQRARTQPEGTPIPVVLLQAFELRATAAGGSSAISAPSYCS